MCLINSSVNRVWLLVVFCGLYIVILTSFYEQYYSIFNVLVFYYIIYYYIQTLSVDSYSYLKTFVGKQGHGAWLWVIWPVQTTGETLPPEAHPLFKSLYLKGPFQRFCISFEQNVHHIILRCLSLTVLPAQ